MSAGAACNDFRGEVDSVMRSGRDPKRAPKFDVGGIERGRMPGSATSYEVKGGFCQETLRIYNIATGPAMLLMLSLDMG